MSGVSNEPCYVELPSRGVLSVSGPDARTLLQGLVTNDVTLVSPARAIYAALLTAQGKYLHDFFMAEHDGVLLIDCERERLHDLQRRLTNYRLRAKVSFEDLQESMRVFALVGWSVAARLGVAETRGAARPLAGGVAFIDPRLVEAGARAILPTTDDAEVLFSALSLPAGGVGNYEKHRIALGLADGSRDMEIEKSILLENGFEELDGVDWKKGCFIGQELTARTKYRALIKKRLLPVSVEGALPAPGTPVTFSGRDAGTMCSGAGDIGLALLRLAECSAAKAGGTPLVAGEARLTPRLPSWLRLPVETSPAS